ncbi:phospholipid/cholesterol/gamma-HCH transport system ATP-binding protein [Treponema bryantii]|uniref:Phospholipid/cholesterol/gamma-HCH transport system ATP-binding protein n=1 Tax=Treponema bryantii TaxID=163 RepID=A0A1H9ER55_9SPIR|nr:ABC transporter ATP-binding protein [Treponema bryantii]SEQ28184.1 phospholipid/cholesterol/gamma-HCH transport system ATP-binding protein [Treponema bryantii]
MSIFKMINVCFEDNGQKIINNISHYIEQSTVTAFLGKPGSGKSTALKLLAGLITPTSGSITFEDKDIHSMTHKQNEAFRKRASFMFQDSALWANQDIYHNLELPLLLHFPDMSAAERKDRIKKITEIVEFHKPLIIRPASLSIGEQKKISFARALICEPEILFLDEPTESIDEKTEDLFISILKDFISQNKTVIYVSHDNYLINSFLCDKIYFEDGEIKEKILLDDINQIDDYYEGDL